MARNSTLSLGEHFDTFIHDQLRHGHYRSESEVLRAGLRLLEAQEAKVKALEAALTAGDESGEPVPFDMDVFLAELRAEHTKALEEALIAGEQSGESVPFDTADSRARMRTKDGPHER